MSLHEQPNAESASVLADRRRPGRRNDVSAELIPILRAPSLGAEPVLDTAGEFEGYERDDLHAARGVLMGVALSAPLWLGIGFIGQWLLS